MSPLFTRTILVVAVLLVTACVTTSTQTTTGNQTEALETVPVVTNPAPVSTSRPVTPVAKSQPKKAMPAVSNMMRQCRQSVSQGRWQNAIANAERGLRIDRREPYFYWTLAGSYQQLGNMPQARNFANQGLRYVKSDQPLAFELRTILNSP